MKIKGQLKIDFDKSAIFQDGLRLTSIDEQSSEQHLEVYVTENIDTANNQPIMVVLDNNAPINNGLLQVKKMSNPSDIIIGILTNKKAIAGSRVRIITRGIVQVDYMFAPILGKTVYITDVGILTTLNTNPQLKLGKIINVSPCKVFIDANNQIQYKTNFENFGAIESRNLEAAMRKLVYLGGNPSYQSFVKPWYGSGTPFRAAWNTNPDKKTQGIVMSGYIWYTEDKGQTWILSDAPTDKIWKQVIFAQNKFIAIASNGAAYSTNGLNWTTTSTSLNANGVAYGNGFFIAVGPGTFYYSTDGITWTELFPSIPTLNAITYSPVLDVFMAVGGTNSGVVFSNPITFYSNNANITLPSLANYDSVVWGFDKFVAGGNSGVAWSFNGTVWSSNATGISKVGYGNMLYISLNKVSSDGINWSTYIMPPDGFYTDITPDNFVFYAGDTNYPYTGNSVMIL